MSAHDAELAVRARALREEFDQAFSHRPTAIGSEWVALLGVRAGGTSYALPLLAVANVLLDRTIVALPSRHRELLGVCSARGAIVPVFDAGALLGHTVTRTVRVVALLAGTDPIGLGFEGFEGLLAVTASELAASEPAVAHGASAAAALAPRIVQSGGVARPVIDAAAVVAAIERRAR